MAQDNRRELIEAYSEGYRQGTEDGKKCGRDLAIIRLRLLLNDSISLHELSAFVLLKMREIAHEDTKDLELYNKIDMILNVLSIMADEMEEQNNG